MSDMFAREKGSLASSSFLSDISSCYLVDELKTGVNGFVMEIVRLRARVGMFELMRVCPSKRLYVPSRVDEFYGSNGGEMTCV